MDNQKRIIQKEFVHNQFAFFVLELSTLSVLFPSFLTLMSLFSIFISLLN